MFFIGMAYLTAMLLMYFSWMLSYAYLDINFMATIFQTLFTIMAYGCLAFFPIMIFLVIANWVHDTKVVDSLTRGLPVMG